jgi:hypothetical protein
MRALRPVPWTALVRGTVVDAFVPFEEGTGWKRRPAVVLGVEDDRRIRIIPVTSGVGEVKDRRRRGAVISQSDTAGLRPEPSAMLWRPTAVERTDLIRVCGALAKVDLEVLESVLGRGRRRRADRTAPSRQTRESPTSALPGGARKPTGDEGLRRPAA